MQDIEVDVTIIGGKSYSSILPSDSPILHDLYVSLASGQKADPNNPGLLLQLPLEDGRAACSFMSSSVISVVTKPAVLIQPQQTQVGDLVTHNNRTPAKHVCIEDFLTPAENKQLLDYTLENEPHFEGSTVLTKAKREEAKSIRQSRVLFKIAESKWRDVFISRLKLHLPHVAATIGLDFQEFESNEIQLTASNDGDFFKQHADADHNDETVANRVVTFVYYLHQMPKPYSGGDLLLYGDPGMSAIDTGSHVTSITPVNNMLVAFPSDLLHEVDIVECPSHAFSDSRFTINGWLRSGAA